MMPTAQEKDRRPSQQKPPLPPARSPGPVEYYGFDAIPGVQGFVDYLGRLASQAGQVPTPNVTQGQMAGYGSSIGPQEAAALDADMQGQMMTPAQGSRWNEGARNAGAMSPAQEALYAGARRSGLFEYGNEVPGETTPEGNVLYTGKTGTKVSKGVLDVAAQRARLGGGVAAGNVSAGAGVGGGTGGGTGSTKAGAPAPAKAPPTPSATGWEEEFYRTHGRFPSEWDYADKLWSVDFAQKMGQSPTRQDWVNHAKQNVYNPARPATPEFAPGFGLDTGFGPNRPAPMSAVPAEVQVPGLEKGKRWEKPTGPARTATPAAEPVPAETPKGEGTWGQLIPESWDTDTTNQAFGQWLAEGGSGEPDEWAAHLQAIGAA